MTACPLCEEYVGVGYCALCGDLDGYATYSVPREVAAAYRLGGLEAARSIPQQKRHALPDRLKRAQLFGLSFCAPRARPEERALKPKPVVAAASYVGVGLHSGGNILVGSNYPWGSNDGDVRVMVGSGNGPGGRDGDASLDILNTGRCVIRAGDTPVAIFERDRVWVRGLFPALLALVGVSAVLGALGGACLVAWLG